MEKLKDPNIRRWTNILTTAAALLIAIAAFLGNGSVSGTPTVEAAQMSIPGCELIEPLVEDGYLVFRCVVGTPLPPTPTLASTATVTSTPTLPPPPTIVPTSTPTQTAGLPYPDAPECVDHDPRAYHSLWNAELGCHYNHTHGDNPHELDDLFGTNVYSWFGADITGTAEISYPWQTPNENIYKHGGYTVLVRSNLECYSQFSTGCITDFRAWYHGVGAAQGAVVANHSFYLEARVCVEQFDGSPPPDEDCGIFRGGGWQGPSRLVVDGQIVLNPEGSNDQRTFLHYFNTGNQCCGTWYNGTQANTAGVVPEFGDMWTTVPPYTTTQEIVSNATWRCPLLSDGSVDYNCKNNSSSIQAHIIFVAIPPNMWRTVNADLDGVADYYGYTDRRGNIVQDCTGIGLDCVPFGLTNINVNHQYQFRGDYREYDVCFTQSGAPAADCSGNTIPSGWIEYQINLPPTLAIEE